jgi:hypothetical protein
MVQYMYHHTWLHDMLCHKSKQSTNLAKTIICGKCLKPTFFGGKCSFFKNQTAFTYFWRSCGTHIGMWENQLRRLYWYGSAGIYIKVGFKHLPQMIVFAISFTEKITLFGNTGVSLNWGESLYPIYNNYKRLLVKK